RVAARPVARFHRREPRARRAAQQGRRRGRARVDRAPAEAALPRRPGRATLRPRAAARPPSRPRHRGRRPRAALGTPRSQGPSPDRELMTRFVRARTTLGVHDVPASIDFYARALGFEVEVTMGEPPNFALLTHGDVGLGIVEADAPAVADFAC